MSRKQLIYSIAIAVVILCLVAGDYAFRKYRIAKPITSPSQSQNQQATLDPLDATYAIDGAAFTLTNGTFKQAAAPGSSEIVTTKIFGEPVYGDINSDGKNDAAVFITQDGGGSGIFYYAAVAIAGNASAGVDTVGTNAIFLGDRIAPDTMRIANGIVTVNYADRKASDPMTAAPSVGVSKYLVMARGTLYDVPVDIYPLPSGFTWNDARAAIIAPGDVNTTSTLAGIKIESRSIINITDLSAKSSPFDSYYKKKLVAAGWAEDNDLAAGGPGAAIIGYRKGNGYIILEYASVFKNTPTNRPEACPCDMTFSVFAGTVVD